MAGTMNRANGQYRHLGGLKGNGTVVSTHGAVVRAEYDLDCFRSKIGQVTASGELRVTVQAIKALFGRTDLRLLTDDGQTLSLRFSEQRLTAGSTSAHVEVSGPLPVSFGKRR